MKYSFRNEQQQDYQIVENLIREAFWNVYRPGCFEHYVMHTIRDRKEFVKELDFVMESDGIIIGQNAFAETYIKLDNGEELKVLTMGPICIDPKLQSKGYGKVLLDFSLEEARKLGFGAVIIEGNINFYSKSGFDFCSKYGIRYPGLPEGYDTSFFLCKELISGYLKSAKGDFVCFEGYEVNPVEVEEFDKKFPPKIKQKLPGQLF